MRAPRRSRRHLAGLVVLAAAALAACGDDAAGRDADGRAVTVVLNWSPNTHHIGLYAAEQAGWFDDAGLDLTIVEPGGDGAEVAVATGRAAFGVSVAEEVLPARAQGLPLVSVAAILPVNDSSLMSLAADGITRPRDLAGATYAGWGGALETELVRRLVACDGGDPDAVEQISIGDAEYLPGLQQDRFDAVWVFNGWDVQRARLAGVDVATIDFAAWADCIPNWYTPLYIASEATVADDPDLVRTFLDVAARGYALAEEDPAEATRLFLDAVPELDAALVEASVAHHRGRWHLDGRPWGAQDRATWAAFEAFLRDSGALEAPVDVDAAFTDGLLGPAG